jgi:hypothetical protein
MSAIGFHYLRYEMAQQRQLVRHCCLHTSKPSTDLTCFNLPSPRALCASGPLWVHCCQQHGFPFNCTRAGLQPMRPSLLLWAGSCPAAWQLRWRCGCAPATCREGVRGWTCSTGEAVALSAAAGGLDARTSRVFLSATRRTTELMSNHL